MYVVRRAVCEIESRKGVFFVRVYYAEWVQNEEKRLYVLWERKLKNEWEKARVRINSPFCIFFRERENCFSEQHLVMHWVWVIVWVSCQTIGLTLLLVSVCKKVCVSMQGRVIKCLFLLIGDWGRVLPLFFSFALKTTEFYLLNSGNGTPFYISSGVTCPVPFPLALNPVLFGYPWFDPTHQIPMEPENGSLRRSFAYDTRDPNWTFVIARYPKQLPKGWPSWATQNRRKKTGWAFLFIFSQRSLQKHIYYVGRIWNI